MIDRSHLLTEQRLQASRGLDRMSLPEALRLFHEQDRATADAVAAAHAEMAAAIELIADRLGRGGRLFYVGAGTSGRMAVLDAAECPPTFSTDPSMVQGIISGGAEAVFRAIEGAEDDRSAGELAMRQRDIGQRDVVFGIAAGGTTPFVLAAAAEGRRLGAGTVLLTCVAPTGFEPEVDITIRALVGPEILTGSTRLKAGTATRMVLNAISTLVMVRLGKVYDNLMVDVRVGNSKLRDRAIRIVSTLCGLDRAASAGLLERAGGAVKTAIVMHRLALSRADAETRLTQAAGRLRQALES